MLQITDHAQPEQAIIIYFDYGKESLEPLYKLEDRLEEILADNKVGEYDGHEINMDLSKGVLYMYGPNAEILYKAIQPVLLSTDFMNEAVAKLRFGPPGENSKQIEISVYKN